MAWHGMGFFMSWFVICLIFPLKNTSQSTLAAAKISSDSEYATPDVDNDMYAVVKEEETNKEPKQEVNEATEYDILWYKCM